MTFRPRAPLPEWARRRARAHDADRDARDQPRIDALIGASMIDIVWSNDLQRGFHPGCRAFIPAGSLGTVDMAIVLGDASAGPCAFCGRPLDEVRP
jgi:hypothetical protein